MGSNEDRFGTQAAVDSAFEVRDLDADGIGILHMTGADGYSSMLLNESVRVGTTDFRERICLKQASHPECSSQVIISKSDKEGTLALHYVDLPMETLCSPLLHVIATNAKKLQDLLAYVAQTVRCIQHDFIRGLELPAKLIHRLRDETETAGGDSPVSCLLHLATTSQFTPAMLEWLTEVVKEVNQKRWEQSVSSMYSNMREHIAINLLPALDRLVVAAGALRGHAGRRQDGREFDVPQNPFTELLDHVDCMRQVADYMLKVVNKESKQFRHFSQWVRLMIEIGVAGPGTKAAHEAEEREQPNLNHALIQKYITQTMERSKIAVHVEQRPDMKESGSGSAFFERPAVTNMQRDLVLMALYRMDNLEYHKDKFPFMSWRKLEQVQDPESLINLPALTTVLAARVRVCVEAISEWQGKMFPKPVSRELNIYSRIFDFRLLPNKDQNGGESSITELLATDGHDQNEGELHLYRVMRRHTQFQTDLWNIGQKNFQVMNGEIKRAVLLGGMDCIMLYRHDGDGGDGNDEVRVLAVETRRWYLLQCDLAAYDKNDAAEWVKVLHTFDNDEDFVPDDFRLGRRPGKEVCVVFGRMVDGSNESWKVLDISGRGDSAGGAAQEVEVEEMEL